MEPDGHKGRTTTAPLDQQFELLRQADASSWKDAHLRHLLILMGAVAIAITEREALPIAWGIGYAVMDTAYVGWLRTRPLPIRRGQYIVAQAANILIAEANGGIQLVGNLRFQIECSLG